MLKFYIDIVVFLWKIKKNIQQHKIQRLIVFNGDILQYNVAHKLSNATNLVLFGIRSLQIIEFGHFK